MKSNQKKSLYKLNPEDTTIMENNMGTALQMTEQARIQEIASLHVELVGMARQTLPMAIRIGQLLHEQKEALPHGQFTAWIEACLPFTPRTARNYMRVFEHRERLKTESVSVLTDAYRVLTPPREEAGASTLDQFFARSRELSPQYTPDEGCELWGRKENDTVWVAPSRHPGFYYLATMFSEGEDDGAHVEGTKKPIRQEMIVWGLEKFGLLLDAEGWEWKMYPCAPWEYNMWLYFSHEEYMQKEVLGQ